MYVTWPGPSNKQQVSDLLVNILDNLAAVVYPEVGGGQTVSTSSVWKVLGQIFWIVIPPNDNNVIQLI